MIRTRTGVAVLAAGMGMMSWASARADDGAGLSMQPVMSAAFASLDAQAPGADATAVRPASEWSASRGGFAEKGTWWWGTGGSYANDLSDNHDVGAYLSVRYFLADRWEFGGQLNVRYFAQEGEDAVGFNPVMIFRYHFLKREKWTAFFDFGIGVMVSTDTVPDRSTSFNFTPRVGVGVTREITDGGARLEAGLTWAHISNARIQGDGNNESRDAPQIYVGVVFPW
jgi:hypothetical protein